LIILLVALGMTCIMLMNAKSKYTAVGRKEIAMFLYLYMLLVLLEFLLVGNIIEMAFQVYPYFVALHLGVINATVWCLLLNGFVGFQFAEDGTPASLWTVRISSFLVLVATFVIAILTFNGTSSPFSPTQHIILWIVVYIIPGAMIAVYIVLQVILVVNTLEDRWPLGDLVFGVIFFVMGQVFMLVLSPLLCQATSHYVDGYFFGAICMLLSVMMVYKYWDSITKEDLEFSVGGKLNVWEVKDDLEPMLGGRMKVFGYQQFGEDDDLYGGDGYMPSMNSMSYHPGAQARTWGKEAY